MTEDQLVCDNCGALSHDDVETVPHVPRIDAETFEVTGEPAEVYRCGDCGVVVGFSPQSR